VNSYNSETPVGGGGGRGRDGRGGEAPQAASPDTAPTTTSMDPPDPEAAGGGGGRGRGGAPPPRVTKDAGVNRVTWDVRYSTGLQAPPGAYQARLKVGDVTETQPFKVLIDPRIAAEGVTAADLKEQFDHNMKMRDLIAEANQVLGRVRSGLNGPKADNARVSGWRQGVLALAVIVSLAHAGIAYGQGSGSTSLSGLVTDTGGGVIPGATVVVKNNATGVAFETISTATGAFNVPALDAG